VATSTVNEVSTCWRNGGGVNVVACGDREPGEALVTDEIQSKAGGVAEIVARTCEVATKTGRDRETDAKKAEIIAVRTLGEVGNVEDVEEGERYGFAGGVDGGDGDVSEAANRAVYAGDDAEVVAGNEVDEVGCNRRVVPARTAVDDPQEG
jgi:phage-related minor tail protein